MKFVFFDNRYLRSRDEEILSALIHTFGLGVSCAMSAALYWLGAQHSFTHTFAGLTYGLAHVITYAASVAYHYTAWPPLKTRLRVIDQAAIYAAIAGTYTPVLLLGVAEPWGITLTVLAWLVCICGIIYKASNWQHPEWGSMVTYITFAALGLLLFLFCTSGPIFQTREVFALSAAFFTGGLVFYVWHYKPYFHTAWHVMTVLGHLTHFYAVWAYFMQAG
jgi:hemolysin III